MHRKAVFALAGVFLAVALIAPPVILFIQADQDLDNITIIENDPGHVTGGNSTIVQETTENHTTNNLIIAILEAIFLPLFLVTLYVGINHTHPEHQPLRQPRH